MTHFVSFFVFRRLDNQMFPVITCLWSLLFEVVVDVTL
jgi:hypothetical protein